jgi:2-(1,2-epoxy-1,2-dihydrophenyl)acetyl-CoA isomerase
MSTQDILFQKTGGIATVTLNRPSVKNALTFAMCRELIGFFEQLRADRDTRVLVLRGTGSDFCSGADLKDVAAILEPSAAARRDSASRQVRELSIPLFLAMAAVPQPVVCSVRGYAVGAGMQFALLADLVVAAESAKFVLPQVRLGHSVDHGESWTLPRKVGIGRAAQLMLLGESVTAADAERYGIANWSVADNELEARTDEIVQRLALAPTVAISQMKDLLSQSMHNSLADQFEKEVTALGICAASDDFSEAIGAFMAKRKPTFTGR